MDAKVRVHGHFNGLKTTLLFALMWAIIMLIWWATGGSRQTLSIYIAVSYTHLAEVKVTGDAAKTVAWKSSDAKVATVDKDGKVTAVAEGTAIITATSTADPVSYTHLHH